MLVAHAVTYSQCVNVSLTCRGFVMSTILSGSPFQFLVVLGYNAYL